MYVSLHSDKTCPQALITPADWDIDLFPPEESIPMARLSILHAKELLRAAIPMIDTQKLNEEFGRRLRRAYHLLEDALYALE